MPIVLCYLDHCALIGRRSGPTARLLVAGATSISVCSASGGSGLYALIQRLLAQAFSESLSAPLSLACCQSSAAIEGTGNAALSPIRHDLGFALAAMLAAHSRAKRWHSNVIG